MNLQYLRVCKDATELVSEVEAWLFREIKRTRARSIFIPAGNTPLPLYARWEHSKPAVLQGIKLCPVDEVTTGPGAGVFGRFFSRARPSYAHALHPVMEELGEMPPVALLGLGLNGHVAFHEPHVKPDFKKGTVELESLTCEELGLEPPVQGLSYGIGAFRECESVAIIASGEKKRDILHRLLETDEPMPARFLMDSFLCDSKRAPNFRIFIEESALRDPC
jgi:6-phosphogluconolactonase/glucosamine-6-phosphate isomerase/deaminase